MFQQRSSLLSRIQYFQWLHKKLLKITRRHEAYVVKRGDGFETHYNYNVIIIYVFVLLYAEIRNFIVTCLLYSCLTNSNVLGKLAIRDLNSWVIQELLLVDLAKTQYTRDDEGPYSRINLDQHR